MGGVGGEGFTGAAAAMGVGMIGRCRGTAPQPVVSATGTRRSSACSRVRSASSRTSTATNEVLDDTSP